MARAAGDRLVGDHFRRIWALVQHIAEHPCMTRAELADAFHLSERQMQADLMVIRHEMGLPLARRSGYVFVDESGRPVGSGLSFADAVLLLESLRLSLRRRLLPSAAMRGLFANIAETCAPHLRPFVREAARRILSGHDAGAWEAAVKATAGGHSLRFRQRRKDGLSPDRSEMAPEILVPLHRDWYVVGSGRLNGDRPRTLMVRVDEMAETMVVEAQERAS